MSEQDREETSPGATRSQHVVLMGPADVRMMTAAMRPGIERSREGGQESAPVCLVITPTADQAYTAAEQARRLLASDTARVVPVSAVTRARRVLATAPVAVVTGTASDLLALRRDAALSLDGLQVVVIIGLDDILANHGETTLQALLGDAPDEVARVATIDVESPETDAFLEAQLRRARRLAPLTVTDAPLAMTPRFIITSPAGRADALRAVLDETDPPSLAIIAHTEHGVQQATDALQRLGMPVDGLLVQVVRQPTAQHVAMTVLWESPASQDALAEALAMRPVDAVALLLPDELPAFRRMTGGLAEAWTPAPKKAGAEDRIQQLRTAVRSTLLNGGATASELALLAPLLDTHDALEIACAALRLYEGAKRDLAAVKARAASAGAKPAASRAADRGSDRAGADRAESGAPVGRQRVFLAAGKRDNVRVGDIVGAIANEAGIPGEKIGQVELFESHAIVELDAADAAKVVEALGSATLRGRRLSARIDERGSERGGDRGGDRGGRGFGGPRGDRGGDRGGDRPRFGGGDRAPRGDRPRFGGERGERSERPRFGGGRPDSRGERPARSFDRGEDRGGRGGFGGPRGGAGRPPRADEERRAFGDRPIRERVENRSEWSERAERMKHAKRPPRTAQPDSEE